MEMQQIRYFIASARELNFTRAAADCGVSQPSLTRAIKLLEAELGGDLFRRERNLTHLTDLGKRILPLLTQSLENAEQVTRLAKAVKSKQAASLSLALPDGVSLEPFLPLLLELAPMFSGLDLRIRRGSEKELSSSLREGELDLLLGPVPSEPWDRYESWTLFSRNCGLVFRQGHKLARLAKVAAQNLVKAEILHRPYCSVSSALHRHLADIGQALPTALEFTRDEDVMLYLNQSDAVAVMPTPPDLVSSLTMRPFDRFDLSYTLHATCVSGRQRGPALNLFLSQLRAGDWHAMAA